MVALIIFLFPLAYSPAASSRNTSAIFLIGDLSNAFSLR